LKVYSPWGLVTVYVVKPVASLRACTVAPGIVSFLSSTTVPLMPAWDVCAKTSEWAMQLTSTKQQHSCGIFLAITCIYYEINLSENEVKTLPKLA
jgi:hypothetical protein